MICRGSNHGWSHTKLNFVWSGMKARCSNPKHQAYKNYGGRGITVCEEWRGFYKFKLWALTNGYRAGLTLERINNNLGYSPDNCRWATRAEQVRNSSQSTMITAFGETKCIMDWKGDPRCEVKYSTLVQRLARNWKPEKAISTKPLRKHLCQTLPT